MENKGLVVGTNGGSALSRSGQDELILKNTPNLSNLKVRFRDMTDSEFLEWFVGFVDGEGCFLISIFKESTISFFINYWGSYWWHWCFRVYKK